MLGTSSVDERLGRGGQDLATLQHWMWERPYEPHPQYTEFKAVTPATIRLDEIDWGGVTVNGIPPLAYPSHVDTAAGDAEYLDDDATKLSRFAAHRAFWFGWYAQFPETTLIK